MKKELERISSRQKAVLSEYIQRPDERPLIHELEKLTVTLASLKERIEVGDAELESVIHDLQVQRDELALAEAKVVSVQEELSQSFRKKEGEQLGELRRRGEGKMK